MAPQNSTLIHENAELTSDLSRYSPIPSVKDEVGSRNMHADDDNVNADDDGRRKSISSSEDINILQDDEVPIWISGEPRFISGLTSTTTCNDIIQALIDDEIHNNDNDVAASRDLNDYVITEKWRDVEQALEGATNILPIWLAWGSSRNEVKFKLKINKNKDRVKLDAERKKKQHSKSKKSAAVSNLLKRLIEQGETIKGQLAAISDQPHRSVRRQIQLETRSKSILNAIQAPNAMRRVEYSNECLTMAKYTDVAPAPRDDKRLNLTDDELFLLIEDDGQDENDSGVHVEYRQYLLNQKLSRALEAKKNKHLRIDETPRRKRDHAKNTLRKNTLNKRLFSSLMADKRQSALDVDAPRASPKAFDGVRYEIAIRMANMNQLIMHEDELVEQLANKCEQYRDLNKIYTRKLGLEMCIVDVQRKLDVYAKDIIRIEMDLFNVKQEIHQKCGILHNLQRMLNTECEQEFLMADEYARILDSMQRRKASPKKFYEDSVSDGSFGPCDSSTNRSLII